MPKGYVVARITVTDPDRYGEYVAMASEAMRIYGGAPLARGGRHEALEGEARPRNVVIEFASYEQARAYYYSEEYQAAVRHRRPAATAELVLVEGV
jgi:uncharacterized protein (DUF1330 family)